MKTKTIASAALVFAAFLGLTPETSFAQEAGLMRLQCAGTFTRLRGANQPNSLQTNSTFVIDFGRGTIVDLTNSVQEENVSMDENTIQFSNPSGASEHLSRTDGSWEVSGDDGYIKGVCKQVTDRNAF